MRTLAITGPSRSGKTTLIVTLIRELVARGVSVAAIKHTHHPLNEDPHRGDTGAFLAAGATPVVLAGDGEAVLHGDGVVSRISFTSPLDLLDGLGSNVIIDVVLIEGFKHFDGWPRITLDAVDVR
jgi:molybdopterin-guanine dinucleotide biosynthesis protein B